MKVEVGRCPVCRAAFRQSVQCTRCGADLAPLMKLSARAFQLRQEAREALESGEFARALQLARRAQRLCLTPGGASLVRLAGLVSRVKITERSTKSCNGCALRPED